MVSSGFIKNRTENISTVVHIGCESLKVFHTARSLSSFLPLYFSIACWLMVCPLLCCCFVELHLKRHNAFLWSNDDEDDDDEDDGSDGMRATNQFKILLPINTTHTLLDRRIKRGINFKNKYLISLFINKLNETVSHFIVSLVEKRTMMQLCRCVDRILLSHLLSSPEMIYSIIKCDVERLCH